VLYTYSIQFNPVLILQVLCVFLAGLFRRVGVSVVYACILIPFSSILCFFCRFFASSWPAGWASVFNLDLYTHFIQLNHVFLLQVLCIFLAGGLHPCAGHFISEHYVFPHLSATQVRSIYI